MNGIYVYLALKEIKPLLVNRFVRKVSMKERLVQIAFDDLSLFVSLFPQAPGFYVGSPLSNFEKLGYFDDHISESQFVEVRQSNYRPVVEIDAEKVVYGQKQILTIKLLFYKDAPNFCVESGELRKCLFSRYAVRAAKKSLFEVTPEELENRETLPENFEGIDKFLARELNQANFERLKAIISGESYKPKLVSVFPMRISLFSQEYFKEYDSLNDLLADGIQRFLREKQEISALKQKENLIAKLEKKFRELVAKKSDTAALEANRIAGELILANISKIKKGLENVILFNPYIQQNIEIKLDPAKTPRENAEVYFRKYKKLRHGIPKIEEQISKIKKQIEALKSGAEIPIDKLQVLPAAQKQEKVAQPFREFVLQSGSKVYVGKNAKSNMELTFRVARPDDYFFHVRGYEGAHTILKPVLQKGQNVRKDDIAMAAAIAAYFSKAKTQKNVPVSYTQRKFLKKNKKGKIGSVVLMKEKVIFVDPRLPSDSQN